MANRIVVGRRDFDNDRQIVGWNVGAGIAATDVAAFAAAQDAWSAGAGGGAWFENEQVTDPGVAATSAIAQSKSQAIAEIVDTVTGKSEFKRIPFPNTGKAADGGTNPAFIIQAGLTVFNPAHADYAALQSEIETNVVSKVDNPVILSRVYIEE